MFDTKVFGKRLFKLLNKDTVVGEPVAFEDSINQFIKRFAIADIRIAYEQRFGVALTV